MVSMPQYLSDDEKTITLAALRPLHCHTFSFRGRGSFSDFGKLPRQVRESINYAVTEYQGGLVAYQVYCENSPENKGLVYYVLGVGYGGLVAIKPSLNLLTPHIIELAQKATEPWSFWKETKNHGLKGIGGIGLCLLIGGCGYFQNNSLWALCFTGFGIMGLAMAYLWSPFAHYRKGLKVAKALLALEVLKSAPPVQSAEDIIRSRGGSFGPVRSEPKPA